MVKVILGLQHRAQLSNPALKFAPSGRWDAPSARPFRLLA